MAQRDVLAGAGGVLLGAARTDHAGRRAVLVVRGEEDTTEFTDLAKTMGIDIVDVVKQRGREDPRTYLGRGRLDEVGDVLRSAPNGHGWHGVDLVLMHTNATPRQLVATSTRPRPELVSGHDPELTLFGPSEAAFHRICDSIGLDDLDLFVGDTLALFSSGKGKFGRLPFGFPCFERHCLHNSPFLGFDGWLWMIGAMHNQVTRFRNPYDYAAAAE